MLMTSRTERSIITRQALELCLPDFSSYISKAPYIYIAVIKYLTPGSLEAQEQATKQIVEQIIYHLDRQIVLQIF